MITTNVLKKPHPMKGTILFLLGMLPAVAMTHAGAWGQVLPPVSPPGTALAGSTTARSGSLWFARGNPAALFGTGRELLASYAPSPLAIAGYAEGSMIARIGGWKRASLGVTADVLGVPGYRETTAGALLSVALTEEMGFGAALSLHSLHIERYGSATGFSFDLGALARLTDRIRFGAAVRGHAGGDQETAPPLHVGFGFAFDMGGAAVLSLDARHELRHGATLGLGLSAAPVPELAIRGGVGIGPTTIGLGIGYQLEEITVEYGGAYISPLGFRHVMGAGIQW